MNALGVSPANAIGDALSSLLSEHEAIQRRIVSIEADGLHAETESDSLAELAASSQHPADVASETFEREVEFGLLEDFCEQRSEVEDAVSRLYAGTYGMCLDCGEPIALERLQALPATTRCLGCQSAAERRNRFLQEPHDLGPLRQTIEFLASDDFFDDDPLPMEEQAMRVEERY